MPFIRVYLHLNRQMSCLPLKLSVIGYGKRVSVVTIRKDINNNISKRQEANGRGYEIQAQYHFLLTEISWWQGRLGVRVSGVGIGVTASGCVSAASSPACPVDRWGGCLATATSCVGIGMVPEDPDNLIVSFGES